MSAPTPQPAPAGRPKQGAEVVVDVTGLDARGRGVGVEAGGAPVVLRHALPGSRVRARVQRRSRGALEARVVELLEPSPDAVEARCPHFGTCGGCAFQDLAYAAQLAHLARGIEAALDEHGVRAGVAVEPVLGAAQPFGYRNKMDFTFGSRRWVEEHEPPGAEAAFGLGLHVPGFHAKVLDVRACDIAFPGAAALVNTARALAREQGLAPWDLERHAGLLRHLVLRRGVRTGEVMVQLVTSDDAPDAIIPYAAALVAAHPEVTTLVQGVNTLPASVAQAEREHVLHGSGVIREELCGLTFTLSAASFFQTNTVQAERLFELVRAAAAPAPDAVVYDLYCGAGAIALVLAAAARAVWGFEAVPAAIADARANARANGVRNATFVEGDVLAALAEPAQAGRPRPDVVVVDPPRAGLHPRVPAALAALGAARLVYVSCNPASAARDLVPLADGGYRLVRVQPVDLFPHTPHVECVLTLERAP
jgi:23S rRNA (uracil1939-C5)-methyltransferase